jgi:hypothetical protein
VLPVDVLADADEAVGVLEEHFLQRDHHALEVPRPLLDVVADLKYANQIKVATLNTSKPKPTYR